MARTVGIGHQDFEKIRTSNLFYIDKTDFIREWWEAEDVVTLITRPRRRQDFKYKYAGEVFFTGLCGQKRFI